MLVTPNEYIYHLGEVGGLTTGHLIIIERRFASRAGFELVKRPIEQVRTIEYFDERPLMRIITGVLLSSLIAFIVAMVIYNWSDLSPSTTLPIGGLLTAWPRCALVLMPKTATRLRLFTSASIPASSSISRAMLLNIATGYGPRPMTTLLALALLAAAPATETSVYELSNDAFVETARHDLQTLQRFVGA